MNPKPPNPKGEYIGIMGIMLMLGPREYPDPPWSCIDERCGDGLKDDPPPRNDDPPLLPPLRAAFAFEGSTSSRDAPRTRGIKAFFIFAMKSLLSEEVFISKVLCFIWT